MYFWLKHRKRGSLNKSKFVNVSFAFLRTQEFKSQMPQTSQTSQMSQISQTSKIPEISQSKVHCQAFYDKVFCLGVVPYNAD